MKQAQLSTTLRVFIISVVLSVSCIVTAALAEAPFKIGYVVPLSGGYTAIGANLRDGLLLYMEQIGNKAGGRDLEVVVEDAGTYQVSRTLDRVRKLMEKDRIDVLAGIMDSGSAYALLPVVEKHDLPFVISNAGADDLTQRKASPLIVRPAFVNSAGSHPLGVWAYEKGFRKAVVMGMDNAGGYEHVGGFCRAFTKAGGRIIQEIWPHLNAPDYGPYLSQINRDADVVMVMFAGADSLRFVTQYAEYGLKDKIPLLSKPFLTDENILPKEGNNALGIISESHWSLLLDTPENVKFREAYIKKFGQSPTVLSEQGYVTGMVIAEALNRTNGKAKGKELVKAMRILELKAPRGPVKFDQFGAPIHNSYLRNVEIVDGAPQNVNFKTYPAVSQFWTWSPEEFMKMTPYADMKGKWAK